MNPRPRRSLRKIYPPARSLLVALVLSFAGSLAVGCSATNPSAANADGGTTTTQASGPRLAPIIYRPANLSFSHPAPLLIALHGTDGTPADMEGMTGFDRVADRYGFVVAYLGSTSSSHAWWTSYDPNYVGYIGSMIDGLRVSQNTDPARVYIAGFSAGGLPSFRAACELPGKVAAIAVVGDPVGLHRCKSIPQPVSQLSIMGTRDLYPVFGPVSAASTAGRFRRFNGCSNQFDKVVVGPVTQQTWSSCEGGSAVGLYVLSGGHHTWPFLGSRDNPDPDAHYDASQAIWQFVSVHSTDTMAGVVRLLTLRATKMGPQRTLLASFGLGEQITVGASLRKQGRKVATRRFRLSAGPGALLRWRLRSFLPGGRYVLTMGLQDRYQRRLQLTQSIHLPAPPSHTRRP